MRTARFSRSLPRHRLGAGRSVPCRIVVLAAALLGGACAPAVRSAPPTAAEIPTLRTHLERNPQDADRMVRLAAAYRAAAQTDSARAVLERAVALQPAHPSGVLLLGVTYEDQQRYGDARRLYERYIAAGPSEALRAQLRQRLPLLQRRELEAQVRAALAREAELAATPPQPRTVAVFPFLYQGDDERLRALGRALADMLTTDLAQTDRLAVLERAQVQLLLDEMRLAQGGIVEPGTAVRSGHLLGAGQVVQGAYSGSTDQLQIQAALVRVAEAAAAPSAATSVVLRDQAALNQLFELEKRLALQTYDALGVSLTPAERERVNQRPTDNIQALLAYGLGLEAMDAGNFEQAAAQFAQAAAIDPGFAAAQARAQTASQAAAAQRTSTTQIAAQAVVEPVIPVLDPAVDALLPTALARDPAAEALGREGIGPSRTVLEVIIRRP